jgi:hypothetical protein
MVTLSYRVWGSLNAGAALLKKELLNTGRGNTPTITIHHLKVPDFSIGAFLAPARNQDFPKPLRQFKDSQKRSLSGSHNRSGCLSPNLTPRSTPWIAL